MITFKLINKKEVKILFDGKEVGRIFTPGGTTHDKEDVIQVCGFDEAYELWGCGIYKDKEKFKKDIQLLFGKDSKYAEDIPSFREMCGGCYNKKDNCRCKDLKLRKNYKDAKAHQVIEKL